MDVQTVKTYDARAADFAARHGAADASALQRILLKHLPTCARVLEIGCGCGREALFLAERGFRVVATDASTGMLEAFRRSAGEQIRIVDYSVVGTRYLPSVEILQATFPLSPKHALLSERFDAVVAVAVIMHLPDTDLFEFAYQLRQMLKSGGTAVLSVSEGRVVDAESRDQQGRLFRERPPAELALLFERLGFTLVAREKNADAMGRGDVHWTTLILRLDTVNGARPVDQIEVIINRDRKVASYKLALLRALCDIAQTASHQVCWHDNDTVSVPLGLISERWLYAYWPLQESGIRQIQGKGTVAFHTALQELIVAGPVKHAGGALEDVADFFTHTGRKTARGKCFSTQGLVNSLGRVHFRAAIWRELCLVGHWIGEAILLRWAELSRGFAQQSISTATILEKLLIRPETQRDVCMMQKLYATLPDLACVWTAKPLTPKIATGKGFVVDHVIPFSLWHNNELWNLLPADAKVNGEKSDRIVTRDKLRASEERIIHYWQETRRQEPFRFDVEISRTLLGRNSPDTQWEHPVFAALLDATEMVAIQRGVLRWPAPLGGLVVKKRIQKDAIVPTGSQAICFSDLSEGEPFSTALPLVAELAAGPLTAGFATGNLDAWSEFDWFRVPKHLAKENRFLVRITGDSMEPELRVGDIAVFEYHRTPRKDGQIVIVADFADGDNTGVCAVKRYRGDSASHWLFVSDNPARAGVTIEKSASGHPILGTFVAVCFGAGAIVAGTRPK
jgi:SAM-dependent methyltransferase/SOS-response transcriptional repressor LexA